MKRVHCGLLRREPSGRWFYGTTCVGEDGAPDPGALEKAVMAAAMEASAPALKPPSAPPVQTSFEWPTEEQKIPVDENETLIHAHRQLWAELDNGTWCPCCQRSARRQPRPIHGEMLEFLIKLVRAWLRDKRWYTMVDIMPEVAAAPKHATDASYFVPWGLLRRRHDARGQYQPDPTGVAFVLGRTTIPRVANVYAARATHFSKEMVSIHEAVDTIKDAAKREMLFEILRELAVEHAA